jgi:hypothetical protein
MMRPDNRVEVGGISSAVSDIYDPQFVKAVFDRCSDRYITFSLICSSVSPSAGGSNAWRRCRRFRSATRAATTRGGIAGTRRSKITAEAY